VNTAILIIIGLIGLLLGLRVLLNANPALLARRLKIVAGLSMIAIAGAFMVAGRWGLALPIGAVGLSLVGSGRFRGFSPVGGGSRGPTSGQQSTVRSAALEMQLDHGSGALRGRVLLGAFTGRLLDEMDQAQLLTLRGELMSDAESFALLEAYLDRRSPGWREHVEDDGPTGHGGAPGAGAMTDEQAHEILGLGPNATTADIRAAHRRLMKRVHPDHGGSDFLAAKINEAKDRLLAGHRSTGTRY
jgi:hypothetical protein